MGYNAPGEEEQSLITAAINTYEEPCSLDVKGLSDTHHLRKPIGVVLEKLIKLINSY